MLAIKDKEDRLIGGLFYFYVLRLLRDPLFIEGAQLAKAVFSGALMH